MAGSEEGRGPAHFPARSLPPAHSRLHLSKSPPKQHRRRRHRHDQIYASEYSCENPHSNGSTSAGLASSWAASKTFHRQKPSLNDLGFPGTGKLTIAEALTGVVSGGLRLVHNHLLINVADAVLNRGQPGYQDLRRRIRAAVFDSLVDEPATHSSAYVFTDAQTATELGTTVCHEYENCADRRGCDFIPITLVCDEETNSKRLVVGGRRAQGKLVDVELLREFRAGEELYSFKHHSQRFQLDVSRLSPEDAAAEIVAHLRRVCPDLA